MPSNAFSDLLRRWLPTTGQPRVSRRVRRDRRLIAEGLERRNLLSVNVVPQQFSTGQSVPLTISQSQLLAGDSDGNVALQASSPTQPAHAHLVDNGDGTFTFTPDATFAGSTSFSYKVSAAAPQTELKAPNGAANDGFGSVAVSGDTAVVGAPGCKVNGLTPQGAAYVFVRSGKAWVEQAELTAADGGGDAGFGGSVAVSGETVVIGAGRQTVNNQVQNQGAAYVFVRSGTTWTQQAELTAADGATFDSFGGSVALSGDTAVIGAAGHAVNRQGGQGAAYVFVRSGTAWTQQAEITAADGAAYDFFGGSVAVSGDTAVVGAHTHAVNGQTGQGAAYVFARSGNAWSQQAELTAANGAANDAFGSSVAVSGDTAVVGATAFTVNGQTGQGAAFVFARSGTAWSQQAELTAANGAANDTFGSSVAVSGDIAVVGASRVKVNGQTGQGAAFAFARSGNAWSQQADFTAADGAANDWFGGSVAVSGATAFVGASGHAVNGNWYQGSAYIQELDAVTATATVNVTMLPKANPDTFVLSGSLANNGSGSTSVLANDTSPDSQPQQLSASLVSSTSHGALKLRADGSFTYTPDATFPGIDRFTYQLSEGAAAGNTAVATLLSYQASLVDKLYHQVLHRSAEDGGLKYWTDKLDRGAALDVVAQAIFNSAERLTPLVSQFYEKYLLRGTDPSGLAYWVADWQRNGGPDHVVASILGSKEFFDEAGDTADGFVTQLYRRVLDRAPETSGHAYWAERLSSGQLTKPQVASSFYLSPEQHKHLVELLYAEYFDGATPTSAQAQGYIAALNAGRTQTQVELAIIDSPDYRATPSQPAAGTVGKALYPQ